MGYHFDWGVLFQYRGLLFEGLVATVQLVAIALVVSLALGVLVGLARTFLPPALSWIFVAYTEFFRNIPPIVQFFFWYFAVNLGVLSGAVVGLSVFTSAYIAEIVRSGIQSIPRTQVEAARSSGMATRQLILYILLPQALIRVIPPLSIEFINLVKNSAVAMTIGYAELTFQSQQIETETFRGFEAATAVTILYIALAFAIVVIMHGFERFARLGVRRG